MSSGKSSTLMAVRIASRDFDAGIVAGIPVARHHFHELEGARGAGFLVAADSHADAGQALGIDAWQSDVVNALAGTFELECLV